MIDCNKIFKMNVKSDEGGCYESSLGVFEDGSENNENDIADVYIDDDYFMDKDKSKESIKQETLNNRIFLRLYKAVYKGHLNPANLITTGINIMDDESITGDTFNHSSVNFNLMDNFIGLTTGGNSSSKFESCTDNKDNPYMDSLDMNKSKFSVFEIPVYGTEYNMFKKIILSTINNKSIKYSIYKLNSCAKHIIDYKIHNKSGESIDYFKNNTNFVCSTFIAYVMSVSSNRIRDYFKKNNINPLNVSPSELTKIFPNCRFLFSGKTNEYNKILNKFIIKNNSYKIFVK